MKSSPERMIRQSFVHIPAGKRPHGRPRMRFHNNMERYDVTLKLALAKYLLGFICIFTRVKLSNLYIMIIRIINNEICGL